MIGSSLQEFDRIVYLTLVEGGSWLIPEASANSQTNRVSCRSCKQDGSKSSAIYLAIALNNLSRVHAPAMSKLSHHLQVHGALSPVNALSHFHAGAEIHSVGARSW